jgi:hypothetical protein
VEGGDPCPMGSRREATPGKSRRGDPEEDHTPEVSSGDDPDPEREGDEGSWSGKGHVDEGFFLTIDPTGRGGCSGAGPDFSRDFFGMRNGNCNNV